MTTGMGELLLGVTLGARAQAQAAAFGLCLAAGVAMGAFALLYLRRASFWERALTDLFATLALCVGAALCCEYILGGKPELYGLAAYALGAALLPAVARAISRRRAKSVKDSQKASK